MDLHAGQIQGFFTIPVDHMTALPLFARHFRDLGLTGEGVVSVSPDAGRAKLAVRFARDDRGRLRDHAQDAAGARRRRGDRDRPADVRGKIAIVGDDVIMTGGTLIAGARGAQGSTARPRCGVFATHGIFCGDALERFADVGRVDGIVVTDTVPIDPLDAPGQAHRAARRRACSPRRS